MEYSKYLCWLINQPEGTVKWQGTKRDLVELVAIVADKKVIKNWRGFALSQSELARRAFAAVGYNPPRHVSTTLWQIRNRLSVMPALSERIALSVNN